MKHRPLAREAAGDDVENRRPDVDVRDDRFDDDSLLENEGRHDDERHLTDFAVEVARVPFEAVLLECLAVVGGDHDEALLEQPISSSSTRNAPMARSVQLIDLS